MWIFDINPLPYNEDCDAGSTVRYCKVINFMSNMYLYRFNCPHHNDCSLVTYANGTVVLTY